MKHLVFPLCLTLAPLSAQAAERGPAAQPAGMPPWAQCAQVQNDDTVRPYDPQLRSGLLNAYNRLFPHARMPADQQIFQATTHIRCMNGRLVACFTGANLACAKINTSHQNTGAEAYCHSNPQARIVPAFATGHDAAYRFRCVAGQPEVTGSALPLDTRGFAATQWAPVD